MLIQLRKKAQSTAEYAMVFGVVLGALALIGGITKRHLAGYINNQVRGALGNPAPYSTVRQIARASEEREISGQRQDLRTVTAEGGNQEILPYFEQSGESRQKLAAGDIADVVAIVNQTNLNTAYGEDISLPDDPESMMGQLGGQR